jgi:hypothetical protein
VNSLLHHPRAEVDCNGLLVSMASCSPRQLFTQLNEVLTSPGRRLAIKGGTRLGALHICMGGQVDATGK